MHKIIILSHRPRRSTWYQSLRNIPQCSHTPRHADHTSSYSSRARRVRRRCVCIPTLHLIPRGSHKCGIQPVGPRMEAIVPPPCPHEVQKMSKHLRGSQGGAGADDEQFTLCTGKCDIRPAPILQKHPDLLGSAPVRPHEGDDDARLISSLVFVHRFHF